MPISTKCDTDLWEDMMQNSEQAFSLIFSRYYPLLINYGKSITKHHYLVSDCIQDVFVDIWNYRNNLKKPESVKAYLLAGLRKRIARKLERDPIFNNSTNIEQVEFCFQFTILDKIVLDEETQIQTKYLNSLINQLPSRQKEVLYLRYYQQLSVNEVAETMQMNYQSTVNLLHRTIKHLRNLWKVENPNFYTVLIFLLANIV